MSSKKYQASFSAFVASSTTMILFPLEKIKLSMMVSDGHSKNYIPFYRNSLDAFRNLRRQGLPTLYRGAHLQIAGSIAWSTYFYIYEFLKSIHRPPEETSSPEIFKFLIASEAAVLSNTLVNPMMVVRTRAILLQNSENWLKDTWESAAKTAKVDGVRGFWRGYIPGLFLSLNGSCTVYLYERFKGFFGAEASWLELSIAGGLSKLIASTVFYPITLTKIKLQQEQFSETIRVKTEKVKSRGNDVIYCGIVDCVKKTYKHRGLRGFYRGLFVGLVKVVPSHALFFTVYEATMRSIS